MDDNLTGLAVLVGVIAAAVLVCYFVMRLVEAVVRFWLFIVTIGVGG